MTETNTTRNTTLTKNNTKDTYGSASKNSSNQEDEEGLIEACLLNCAYADYQVDIDTEVVKKYTPSHQHRKGLVSSTDGVSMIQDVVLSVTSSDSDSFDDNKSLLDYDSSSSSCSFVERSRASKK